MRSNNRNYHFVALSMGLVSLFGGRFAMADSAYSNPKAELRAFDTRIRLAKDKRSEAQSRLQSIESGELDWSEYPAFYGGCQGVCDQGGGRCTAEDYKKIGLTPQMINVPVDGKLRTACAAIYEFNPSLELVSPACKTAVSNCGQVARSNEIRKQKKIISDADRDIRDVQTEKVDFQASMADNGPNCVDCNKPRQPGGWDYAIGMIQALTPTVLGGLNTWMYTKSLSHQTGLYSQYYDRMSAMGIPPAPPPMGFGGGFGGGWGGASPWMVSGYPMVPGMGGFGGPFGGMSGGLGIWGGMGGMPGYGGYPGYGGFGGLPGGGNIWAGGFGVPMSPWGSGFNSAIFPPGAMGGFGGFGGVGAMGGMPGYGGYGGFGGFGGMPGYGGIGGIGGGFGGMPGYGGYGGVGGGFGGMPGYGGYGGIGGGYGGFGGFGGYGGYGGFGGNAQYGAMMQASMQAQMLQSQHAAQAQQNMMLAQQQMMEAQARYYQTAMGAYGGGGGLGGPF